MNKINNINAGMPQYPYVYSGILYLYDAPSPAQADAADQQKAGVCRPLPLPQSGF